MNVSLNEVQNLAAKAARGAGLEPASAAQYGRAAVCHLLEARDPEELAAALDSDVVRELPIRLMAIAENGGGRLEGACDLHRSYVAALPFAAELAGDGEVTVDFSTPAPKPSARRCPLPEPLRARWTSLAAKTFVPETAASRLSGAGAGLTDND